MISNAAIAVAFLASFLSGVTAASAATLETETIGGWTLNAYSADHTGGFQNCTMKTPGNDQVSLTVSANAHDRWFLWLQRSSWDLAPDTRFVATLNLDQGRKQPIALDAKVKNDRFIVLALPPDEHVLNRLSHAASARVTRETKVYTFQLAGYDKAVQWMKACVARHTEPDVATQPDARITGADDDTDDAAGIVIGKDRPADVPKVVPKVPIVPKAPANMIEVRATDPTPTPSLGSTPTPVPMSTPAAPGPEIVALAPQSAAAPTSIFEAAKASTATINEPSAPASPAQLLLPSLMAAANHPEFRLLETAAAPAALKRADVVFSLEGVTGVVLTFDLPTAAAVTNEVLAYDRIACGGTYSSVTDPAEEGHADVLRSTAECRMADTLANTHFVTMARKAGGYFVIALTSETPLSSASAAGDRLAATDRGLIDAAVKVSGKF